MELQKALAVESQPISNAYYDSSTRSMNQDDLLFNNRYKDSFQSKDFQGTNIFNIQNADFISECFLAMRFKGVASAGANKMATVPLMAYSVIDRVEVQVAGSDIYTQYGINMLHEILAVCDSKSKRDEIIKFGGGAGSAEFTADATYYAFLNLPWSVINKEIQKLPYDTSLIKQPISIKLYLKPATSVYYQTGGTGLTIPSVLAEGELIVRQGQLKDPSAKLKLDYMKIDTQTGLAHSQHDLYNYPFTYAQSIILQPFTGSLVNSPVISIPLLGFRKGNLTGIRFMLYNTTTDPINQISSVNSNILKTEDLLNFELKFNGNVIFRSKYDSWKMSNLLESNSDLGNSVTPYGTYYYSLCVNMVDFLEKIAGERFQSGMDLSSQSLVAEFNTTTTNTYNIWATYLYHAHLSSDGVNASFIVG